MLIPNLGRIAETAHTRAQDGAMSGPRGTFLGAQVEAQKAAILGAYKIDVGEAKKANKKPVLGVENGTFLRGLKMEPFSGPSWNHLGAVLSGPA